MGEWTVQPDALLARRRAEPWARSGRAQGRMRLARTDLLMTFHSCSRALRSRASVLAAATPLAIAAGLIVGEAAGSGRGGAVLVLFPVLVGALALADRGPAMVLAHPMAVSSGRISFSLYLVHVPIFEVFWTALRHFPVTGRPACFAALTVLLSTVLVAGIAYHLVEEPARRRMRRIARPAAERVPAVELVAARRAARAGFVPPLPRHAATAERAATLAGALAQVQQRRPTHRVELARGTRTGEGDRLLQRERGRQGRSTTLPPACPSATNAVAAVASDSG